ncbi:hypothetical protein [Methanothermobacter sp. DP]|uniref:hypothetical protein n=1 Tax=Methanothermobacter sp. DP TaxID=2998972 RepID=UPI002AA5D11C|nr:hypothetical protein [Methanothermobacter sp. DP]
MEPAYYYHDYPVCPNCNEPAITGAPLLMEDDETFMCSSCGAFFSRTMYLHRQEKLYNLLKKLKGPIKKDLSLLWSIKNNPIEKSYLKWLPQISSGKYLITWPWKDVRFIPLLICEYLRIKKNAKIIVVGEIHDKTDRTEFGLPDPFSAFESLHYIENMSFKLNSEDYREFKRIISKIDRKNIFKKKKKIHYRIKDLKNKHVTEISFYNPEMTLRKCRNRILKHYNNLYGMDAVKSITLKNEKGQKKKEMINDAGIINITIEERCEWTGERLRFPKFDMFSAILHSDSLIKVKEQFKYDCITEVINTDISGNSAVFISQFLEPDYLFGLIEEFNPDIVFFTDSDFFVNERLFRGRRWRKFQEFILSTDHTILMFSIRPDSRHLYRDLMDSLTAHTWDCVPILDILFREKDNSIQSPFSSSLSELSLNPQDAKIEYVHVDELDRIEETSERILKVNNDRTLRKYLRHLPETPLHLSGPYRYSMKGWVIDNILNELLDTPLFDEVKNTFEDVYSVSSSSQQNPILNSMKDIIESEVAANGNQSIFVVLKSREETKKLKRIFETDEENSIVKAVEVCTWNDLPNHYEKNNSVVITTSYPPIDYSMNDTQVTKFYFIGGSRNLKKIKSIVENRITEQVKKPLHIPARDENAPALLFDVTEKISDQKTVKEEILKFEKALRSESHNRSSLHERTPERRKRTIKPGTECVLAINEMNEGMFIPPHRILFFKDEYADRIEHIRAGSKAENLQNRSLLLDEHGFYASFKILFTQFMIEIAPHLQIKRSYYIWNGFGELVEDSYEWLKNMKTAVEKLMNTHGCHEERAKDYLSKYLVKFDLNARNHEYIKTHWLSEPEIIKTSGGYVPIFDVEHPKGLADVEKIYMALNELFPEMGLDEEQARKSYIASLTLQEMRRKFLTDGKQSLPLKHHRLYDELWKEIKHVLKRSGKFKIKQAKNVKVKISAPSMKILPDYERYIR